MSRVYQPSLPRISFLSCKTISDQADSFRQKLFNLHVTTQGRHWPSTVAVKIATTSSYFLSALVRKTVPSRIRQTVKAKIFLLEINFIMNYCPQVLCLYIPQGSDRGALSKQIEGGLIAILFFLKHSDF